MRVVDVEDCTALFVFMVDACRTEDSGSLEEELIKRALHYHPLFKEENDVVLNMLEEGTSTTECCVSNKPFQRKKDDRSAWLSMLKQHAGDDQ